jgi:hypothetical protein
MAKIDVTKTELIWPGKYNEDGSLREVPSVNLPFQVIERCTFRKLAEATRINSSRVNGCSENSFGSTNSPLYSSSTR